MLNHITIMGRFTKDPEIRKTASGTTCANFTIACERDFADKHSGEKETDFIDCVAWHKTAEFIERYFGKGRMAVVAGRLQKRKWEDKNGNKRETAEIVVEDIYFADSKKDGNTNTPNNFATLDDDDSNLPF